MSEDGGREFGLYIILAVTHGLPSMGQDYREILEYLSGQSIPTPSASLGVVEPCAAWLIEQHPQLADVPPRPNFGDSEDRWGGDEDAMDAWAARQATRLGASSLIVRPLPEDRRQFPPHLERVMDHVDPTKVVIVDPTKPDGGLTRPTD